MSGKYVECEGTERELHNLNADPYELTDTYDPDATPDTLVPRQQALESCGTIPDPGQPTKVTCEAAENGQ